MVHPPLYENKGNINPFKIAVTPEVLIDRRQRLNTPWQKSRATACSRARLCKINVLPSRDR
jgi:hypothetical protein